MNDHDPIEAIEHEMAPLLDALGSGGKPGEPPRAFMGRVRRRRLIRRATRATGAVVVVVLATSIGLRILPTSTPSQPTWTYAEVRWPPMSDVKTGGPVLPIRAGIRPTDPMAISLLQ